MKTFLLAGAAAIALAFVPAAAQDDMSDMDMEASAAVELSASQQAMYDAWPAERRAMYDAWPATYQTYFWTLTPTRMNGWWVLTDDQRAKVYAMTPDQRTAAWTAIAAQMSAGGTTATTSATASTTGAAGNMRFVSNEMVQSIPGDAPPPSGDLPICSPNQQDGCINAWEAGKRGPGVTRPLDHWPGMPASEMDGSPG